MSSPFDTPFMVPVREIELALAESSGIEAAQTRVAEAVISLDLPSQGVLTPQQAARVCSLLMRQGGLVAMVAESFLNSLEKRLLKTVEQTLWRSEEMLGTLVDTIPSAIYMKDTQGRLILVNEAYERIAGKTRDRIIGEMERSFLPEETALSNGRVDRWVLSDGKQFRHEFGMESAGRHRVFEAVKTPVKNGEGQVVGLLGVLNDVTDSRLIQEELLKAVRLESVGQLAGGIAHDFNNLLTVILGAASLAARKIEQGQDPGNTLNRLQEAAQKAKALTHRLLTFSTGGAPIKRVTDFRELLEEAVELALSGTTIRCVFEFPVDLHMVHCDRGQLSQAIRSIVLNAVQAMPGGGTITVSTINVRISDSRIKDNQDVGESLPLDSGDYIRFCIRDHGSGIPRDISSRIFDPYFTTRDKSTGLGLPTAYSVLRRHRGFLRFEPPPGGGAAFYGYLPSAGDVPAQSEGDKVSTNNLKILVMDDEPMVLETIGEMLEILGHSAGLANTGETVIKMYEDSLEAGEPYDLLILDLTVPGGVGGEETLKTLRSRHPDVKAFVSSGYSNNPIMANHERFGFVGVIAKPYHLDQLGDTILNYLAAEGLNLKQS
ncbi:MAG: PAS domain-containing protein [Candidatus Fermentibacteraceae bacterium]